MIECAEATIAGCEGTNRLVQVLHLKIRPEHVAHHQLRVADLIAVEGPWLIGLNRRYPVQALSRLNSLLRTGERE